MGKAKLIGTGVRPRVVARLVRKGLLVLILASLVLVSGVSETRPSTVDLVVTPYRFSLVGWELGNLPDKWVRKLGKVFHVGALDSRGSKIADASEFFDLGQELARLERQRVFPKSIGEGHLSSDVAAQELSVKVRRIKERLRVLQAGVEETIEGEVSDVLTQQGLSSSVGVFPPVDAVFSSAPHVLVLSPRDRIYRQEDVLLVPGLTNEVKEDIEQRILRDENLSALVENTGGVALYPSVVSNSLGMRHALEITAHEWLHQWFFFRPLGRGFWRSPEMTILNETAATIAGEELGDLVFTSITGEQVNRNVPGVVPGSGSEFDFNFEMQATRVRAEELLGEGKILEAEAYMEQRRQLFVANGFLIRKINQAYFAFHGTYATSAAAVSPIGEQLEELRSRSDSVQDFVKTVAEFGSYREFLDHLESLRMDTSGSVAGE